MSKTFIIEVPDYLEEEQIEGYFRDNIDELRPAMDLELEDDRAQIDEIEIENFGLSDDSVHIEYGIQHSAYYGCKDMNYADEDQRVVSGRRNGRSFEFDVFVPPPRRSTFEEY
jgi:hypothetical protein